MRQTIRHSRDRILASGGRKSRRPEPNDAAHTCHPLFETPRPIRQNPGATFLDFSELTWPAATDISTTASSDHERLSLVLLSWLAFSSTYTKPKIEHIRIVSFAFILDIALANSIDTAYKRHKKHSRQQNNHKMTESTIINSQCIKRKESLAEIISINNSGSKKRLFGLAFAFCFRLSLCRGQILRGERDIAPACDGDGGAVCNFCFQMAFYVIECQPSGHAGVSTARA